jgi:hypothetical protein
MLEISGGIANILIIMFLVLACIAAICVTVLCVFILIYVTQETIRDFKGRK